MMASRRLCRQLVLWLVAALLVCCSLSALAARSGADAGKLRVAATFSILADMTRVVGGEHVVVTAIVGPDGNAHAFEPSPDTIRALAHAQVLVRNGLGFEPWLPRMIKAAHFRGLDILASRGVEPRQLDGADHDEDHHGGHESGHHDHVQGIDPHAWQSLDNGVIYVRNIAAGLAKADPIHAGYYAARARRYIGKLESLDASIKAELAGIPSAHRVVITTHDAFGYFAAAYGIRFLSIAGFSTEAEPGAGSVAHVIDMARAGRARAIFIENMTNPNLIRQIARETGMRVGGLLYSDALAKTGEAATYLGMFRWNAKQLLDALGGTPQAH